MLIQKHGMTYALKQSKGEDIAVGLICLVFDEYNYGGTTWTVLRPTTCIFDRCFSR